MFIDLLNIPTYFVDFKEHLSIDKNLSCELRNIFALYYSKMFIRIYSNNSILF